MSNEESHEGEEPVKKAKTFTCKYCEEPQEEFLYNIEKRGWAKCPNCGKHMRVSNIPDDLITRVEPETKQMEEDFEEEEETRRVPFRRPRPPHLVLNDILKEFGVKSSARTLIVRRCKRAGEIHPTDLQRMLRDLDSGVKGKETSYIAEEYYYALESESQEQAEYSGRRTYPRSSTRSESTRGGGMFMPTSSRRGSRSSRSYDSRQSYRSKRKEPWERSDEPLDRQTLMDILERRDREFEQRMERQKREKELGNLREMVVQLTTELKNMKENPPSAVPPDVVTKADLMEKEQTSYVKALQLQMENLKEDRKELMGTLKEDRNRHREDLKELQQAYNEQLEGLQKKLEEERRRAQRGVSSDWERDEFKLAAEGMNRLTDVLDRKSPIRDLTEAIPQLMQAQQQGPPEQRQRMGQSSVADLVGEDYTEE